MFEAVEDGEWWMEKDRREARGDGLWGKSNEQ